MKAVFWSKYGSAEHLKIQQIPKPETNPNEILIKVHASAVTTGDARIRSLNVPLGFKPLTPTKCCFVCFFMKPT